MADTQFGQYAHFSGRTPEEIARYQRHRLNVRAAPRVTHFREETRRFPIFMARAEEPDEDYPWAPSPPGRSPGW